MASSVRERLKTVQSTSVKAPCKAIAASNVTLSGEQTVDSRALVTGDRVLCSAQTASAENGPWVVDTSGWTRPSDFNNEEEILSGALVVVDNPSGTTGTYFIKYTGDLTLGTTALTVSASNLSVLDEDLFTSNSSDTAPSQQSTAVYIAAEIESEQDAWLIDEDLFTTNSATRPPSQQSVKTYVDTEIADNVYSPSKPVVTVITASTTHNFQADTIWARVVVQGAGGGGGGSFQTGSSVGGGGAGGGYSEGIADVDALVTKSATIVIGTGGAGGASSTFGSDGTSSSYDDGTLTMTCNGGDGGSDNDDTTTVINGGSATGGSFNMAGWYGNRQNAGAGTITHMGGASMLGEASRAGSAVASSPERDGHGYGSGGTSGKGNDTAAVEAGGDGADGVVIIYEYK